MQIIKLFISFLKIGLFSIGGGYATLPLIQEQIVMLHGWLSLKEYTDIIVVSQMTPGPLAVNAATFVGIQVAGLPGAIAATVGCVICGCIISLTMFRFLERHQERAAVKDLLSGFRSISVGLILSAGCSVLLLALTGTMKFNVSLGDINAASALLFGVAVFLLQKYKVNSLLIMILTGLVGFVIYQ